MQRARTPSRELDRHARGGPRGSRARGAIVGGVLASALLLGACDSVSGIPGDDPAPARAQATTSTTTAPPAPTSTTPVLPPPAADAPPVGEVAGLPEAATAVRRWAADLRTADPDDLQAKCWSMAPGNVSEMYQGEAAILAALAQPGTASETTVTWKTRATTVTVERSLIDTGYACPRVFPAGTQVGYNDADARHTVRRYLARVVGEPLDPADAEADYPLVCAVGETEWDPRGTGTPTRPPLAAAADALKGVTEFDGQEISSSRISAEYLTVAAPVTDSTGTTKTRTFTLAESPRGYCIGDITP
ncbi:hypothetical protein ACTD5D_01545 [Nocardia takedensis]|uniref:hypothetical protein n=1 Tax=Nocardia takedensis TaxID=259390 RepID=UPI00030732BC|nr:hypothetical protein [Nocardia takedensis]